MVTRNLYKSNPTLSPDCIVSQITPGNDLRGLGKCSFDLHPLDRIAGQLGGDDPNDQKVFLFGHGLYSRPFAQQQFFGVQGIHSVDVFE